MDEPKYPEITATLESDEDENIIHIAALSISAMMSADVDPEEGKELADRLVETQTYEEALAVVREYVTLEIGVDKS